MNAKKAISLTKRRSFQLGVIVLLNVFLTSNLKAERDHYYSDSGVRLAQYNAIWKNLFQFYGSHLPQKIIVKINSNGGAAYFNVRGNKIIVDVNLPKPLDYSILHESSHLALSHMTKGASTTGPFRFIDEGLAEVIANKYIDNYIDYKKYALSIAGWKMSDGKISIRDVQNWTVCFGEWRDTRFESLGRKNFDVYEIGASFIFYVLDSFGEGVLKKLLTDIGKSKSFEKSVWNILEKTLDNVEKEWISYIMKQYDYILASSPKGSLISSMDPANGASRVKPDIDELVVKFNMPMLEEVCLTTDCKDICYDNVIWKDRSTLVIKLPNKLHNNETYILMLGNRKHNCLLKTITGQRLPVTTWYFKTGQ